MLARQELAGTAALQVGFADRLEGLLEGFEALTARTEALTARSETAAERVAALQAEVGDLRKQVSASQERERAVAVVAEERLARLAFTGRRLPRVLVDAYLAVVRPVPEPTERLAAARRLATALAADADYPAALDTLADVAAEPGVLDYHTVFLVAELLRATSRYDAARDVARLAGTGPRARIRAGLVRAQTSWVVHDYAAGAAAAREVLAIDPGNVVARTWVRRNEEPITPRATPSAPVPTGGVGHAALYLPDGGNFGDVVLPHAVRRAIEAAAGATPSASGARPLEWLPVHVHQLFDDERVELANAQRALVVGGGGLFLPDTAPNANSGWQWNVPRASLERLDVPLHVFAVGYNLFRGQSFRGGLFHENLVALTEHAAQVGLRNHGSIDRVRDLLPAALQGKVTYVPCPTTVLRLTHPDAPVGGAGSGRVYLNAAFDRSERRFEGGYPRFLAAMARYVRALRDHGADVALTAHLEADARLATDLAAEHEVDVPVVAMYGMRPEEGYRVYADASLVVGMRGHATMIPFGLGTPVLSLVSHPKTRYFLEDVRRPEWGFEVNADRLGDELLERSLDVLAHEAEYRQDVSNLQADLWEHVSAAARLVLPDKHQTVSSVA